MYITFDYKCPNCDHVETRFVRKEAKDSQYHYDCLTDENMHPRMVRLPAGTRTTFKFADTNLKA